ECLDQLQRRPHAPDQRLDGQPGWRQRPQQPAAVHHGLDLGEDGMSEKNSPPDRDGLFLLLGRLEGKLDAALPPPDRHEARLDGLEDRVTEAEKARTKDRAFAAGIGATIATGMNWFKDTLF